MYLSKWPIKVLLFLTVFLFSINKVEAQRGCCSYHGGISYCASNGRYVCNDGTYSPTCTCFSYSPPPPPSPEIPDDTNGRWKYVQNSTGGVDLHFDWNRPEGNNYSITLNKKAGANPGPLADTSKSEYIFKNITPGIWYINLKEMMSGQWSQVSYWTIEIPNDVKEQALPLSTPTPIPTPVSKSNASNKIATNDEDSMSLFTGLLIALGVPIGIVFFGKSDN